MTTTSRTSPLAKDGLPIRQVVDSVIRLEIVSWALPKTSPSSIGLGCCLILLLHSVLIDLRANRPPACSSVGIQQAEAGLENLTQRIPINWVKFSRPAERGKRHWPSEAEPR
jgi:hypothetical protein